MTKQLISKKTEYWKKKLIDLSKRNNLVSYRFSKTKSLKILEPEINQLLTDLYNEKNIIFTKKTNSKTKERRWSCSEEDEITDRKLIALYRKTRENYQELGINSCFVSFYMLKYKDNEKSEDYLSAPLFLFPVNIRRLGKISKHEHRFEIISGSEDLQLNPALIEKLKNNYGIEVPQFDGEIEPFIPKLKEVISGRVKWKVTNDVYLDIFSYQKYIMYADLEENKELLLENNLIKCFVGDRNALQDQISESQRDVFNNDINGVDVLLADSSQKKAIELAKAGVTFVLQGPPGTGKSQTIANIISALIEKKKKILFVSQKMAALDVVQKRLDDVGLGRYCLNLHNYKGNKKEIIRQLMTELETSPIIKESVKRYSFNTYLENQDKINQYYEFLSKKHKPRNFSIYELRGELARLLDVKFITQELNESITFTEEIFSQVLNIIDKMDHICTEIPYPTNSIYFNFKKEKNTSIQREKLRKFIGNLIKSSSFIDELTFNLKKDTKVTFANIESLNDFSKKHHEFKKIKNVPGYLCSKDFYDYKLFIGDLVRLQTIINESTNLLKEKVKDDFLEFKIKKSKEIFENTNALSRLFNKEYKEEKIKLKSYSKNELNHKEWTSIFKNKEQLDNTLKSHSKLCESNKSLIKKVGDVSNLANLKTLKTFVDSLDQFFVWAKVFDENQQFKIINYLYLFSKNKDFLSTFA